MLCNEVFPFPKLFDWKVFVFNGSLCRAGPLEVGWQDSVGFLKTRAQPLSAWTMMESAERLTF